MSSEQFGYRGRCEETNGPGWYSKNGKEKRPKKLKAQIDEISTERARDGHVYQALDGDRIPAPGLKLRAQLLLTYLLIIGRKGEK